MKCQNERERINCRKEAKFDKLSLNPKHNELSQGARKNGDPQKEYVRYFSSTKEKTICQSFILLFSRKNINGVTVWISICNVRFLSISVLQHLLVAQNHGFSFISFKLQLNLLKPKVFIGGYFKEARMILYHDC